MLVLVTMNLVVAINTRDLLKDTTPTQLNNSFCVIRALFFNIFFFQYVFQNFLEPISATSHTNLTVTDALFP